MKMDQISVTFELDILLAFNEGDSSVLDAVRPVGT